MPCNPYDQSSSLIRGNSDSQCPKDWQVILADQGVTADIEVTIPDPKLLNIDVADASLNEGDVIQACRLIYKNSATSSIYAVAYVTREGPQTFTIHLQSGDVVLPGLFLADLAIYEVTGASYNSVVDDVPDITYPIDVEKMRPIYVNRMYLEVAPNNTIPSTSPMPLSIAEVRLSLRDLCPSSNFLLDDYEFTDKEIMFATMHVVDYWNEQPPPTSVYSYTSFPFRYHWLKGTAALLYQQVGRWKLRNWLPYQGGNVSVNDQSIWKMYHDLGDQYWQEFTQWVTHKKVEQNIEGGFSSSPGFTAGW